MTLPPHSEFDRLCELAPTGELSAEDRHRLLEHLQYCEVCRASLSANREFTAAITAAFALADDDNGFDDPASSNFDVEAGKRRLLDVLEMKPPRRTGTRLVSIALVGFTGTLACFGFGLAWHEHRERMDALQAFRAGPLVVARGNEAAVPAAPPAPNQSESQSQVPLLRQRLFAAKEQESKLQEEITSISQRLDRAEQEKAALSERTNTLEQQLASADSETGSLREQVALSGKTLQLRATERDREIASLRASLAAKDTMIAENEDLLSHDRDIRDLMGARNLIIEDIYDVAENGQKKKPVGRIFYTKDKRLLFYGYDLDKQQGLKKDAVFQAWGNNQAGTDVNLGLFYRDDANKRWVLKFSDASTLARLTSVFVTVEPSGGSGKPTGKRLLATSLRIEPNYP